MKITLTKQEVEKIILDYANKMVEGYEFNHVVSDTYRDIPDSVTIAKDEK